MNNEYTIVSKLIFLLRWSLYIHVLIKKLMVEGNSRKKRTLKRVKNI